MITGDIIIPNWLSLTDTFAEYTNRDKIIDIGRIDFFKKRCYYIC